MFAFVIVCFLPVCLSQVLIEDRCPLPDLQADFDISRYTGKWYQASAYPFIQTGDGKCNTAQYTPREDGTFEVNNTVYDFNIGGFRSAVGTVTVEDPENPASLCVRFSGPEQPCGQYQIVSTDYDGSALVHSCAEVGLLSLQANWILTRVPNPDPAIVEERKQFAESVGIPRVHFEDQIQDCGN